ncbi:hypothetical protein Fmac_013733 [Flemingia macrophylla]|uniref:Uncharacterized protein n=1 Tax=Flemingia macrophylla TaxID=520843 RepID=A0ABD1MUU4_9FABA
MVPAKDGSLLPFHLSVLVEISFEGLSIVFKAERGHGPQKIITVDCLSFLFLALV